MIRDNLLAVGCAEAIADIRYADTDFPELEAHTLDDLARDGVFPHGFDFNINE